MYRQENPHQYPQGTRWTSTQPDDSNLHRERRPDTPNEQTRMNVTTAERKGTSRGNAPNPRKDEFHEESRIGQRKPRTWKNPWRRKQGKQPNRREMTSGKKFCVRTLHTRRKRLDAQDATRQGILRSDNACQRTCRTERDPPVHMRTRQKWAAHWPSGRLMSSQTASGRRMPRHLPSGRGVSAHLPFERSACLTDAECQGKCLRDYPRHGICLPDEECQGICLLNAAHFLQTQSVKADVVRTRSVRAFAF